LNKATPSTLSHLRVPLAGSRRLRLRFRVLTLAGAFVMTGCAGLLAEQCFEKLLTQLVGASTPAAALVLAVYFLGLTLGAMLYARARPPAQPLRRYALLEAGVATWSLLLLATAGGLVTLLSPLLRLGSSSFLLMQLLRAIVAVAWILPPTLLMGATFPVIVDVLEQWRIPRPRRAMAAFYSLNLLGAILGALLGPYWAFPRWGLDGTLIFTFLVDGTAALIAWGLASGARPRAPRESVVPLPGGALATATSPVLLGLACLSGFLFFSLEVLWTHLLSVVIGTSVYAFAAVLAIVLVALGLGGWLATVLFRGDRLVPAAGLGVMLLIASGLLTWQYGQWPGVPPLFVVWGSNLTRFDQGELLRWIQAGRLLLLPATVMGMVYPTLFRMQLFPAHERGRAAGRLSASNSVGCVMGALVTAFLLIPQLGSEATLRLMGFLLIIASVVLAWHFGRGKSRVAVLLLSAATAWLWAREPAWDRLSLTHGGHVNFTAHMVGPDTQLAFFHEDAQGITTVVRTPSPEGQPVLALLTNGKFQANDSMEVYAQIGFALIPTLHVREPGEALVIGLGSGQSAAVVEGMGFRHIDIAEISAGIVRATGAFFSHINGGILTNPRVDLHQDDGRNYLLLSRRRYDLVTMEISNVWFAGATSLYSREFYALARQRLKPGGMMQQWVQLHHISPVEVGSILATMHAVFPYVSLWLQGGQGILVGSVEPQRLQPWVVERLAERNPWKARGEETVRTQFQQVLLSRLLAPADTDRLVATTHPVVNTDWNRFLEYATPRYSLGRYPWTEINLRVFASFASFPGHELQGDWPAERRVWTEGLDQARYRAWLGLPATASGVQELPAGPS
jgi:spermidine synthase